MSRGSYQSSRIMLKWECLSAQSAGRGCGECRKAGGVVAAGCPMVDRDARSTEASTVPQVRYV